MWLVYEIRTQDNKVYVGCTKKMNGRMAKHRHLQMPFVMQDHTLTIVFESLAYEEAAKHEEHLIQKYDSTNPDFGYNRRFGDQTRGFPDYVHKKRSETVKKNGGQIGERNSNWGKKHTEETKDKIRQRALARDPSTYESVKKKTPEQIEKLHKGRKSFQEKFGSSMQGKQHSEETKKLISEAAKGNKRWLGRKHSEESKAKMRETKRLKKLSKLPPSS